MTSRGTALELCDQIGDAFRAAGFDAEGVELLTRTVRQRIAALEAL
jgi:hypothetical protein